MQLLSILLVKFTRNRLGLLLGIRQGGINLALVLLEKILEEGLVEKVRAVGLGRKAPKEKGRLEGVIKGNPVDEEIGEGLEDGEKGENDPVDQPLMVVRLGLGLDGFEALEGGVDKADERGQEGSADAEDGKENAEDEGAQYEELFRNGRLVLCVCFQ